MAVAGPDRGWGALGRELGRALGWLVAGSCVACGAALPPEPSALSLCRRCRLRLSAAPARRCPVCSLPVAETELESPGPCLRCRKEPRAFDRLHAAFLYQPPIDAVVRALKFGRLEFLGRHLAREIVERIGADLPACDAVVPIPLAWPRRLRRGFNQAALIARPIALWLETPCRPRLLRRAGTGAPQTRSTRRARRENVAGAFQARGGCELAGLRILLVDDVATTTATLHHAALALRGAGAAAVSAVVAARTVDRP